jgi:hypothetical protein
LTNIIQKVNITFTYIYPAQKEQKKKNIDEYYAEGKHNIHIYLSSTERVKKIILTNIMQKVNITFTYIYPAQKE